ncbi:nickel pincer cofactor biosynthesis protein LarC [Ilumatobacter coccineus]|uniref:Pyridinium-3,5-bisthiocarboxylic acid mononucleotide nickel insertion protein n=1 Tax=Ilumatobacter coccineus (strain NBRC 103263 / KCTC 29153 / YM16-304) TaxID=1313172 RepID=A0A6C7EFP8_ILUCY|nr:nickel pincer cofactor biosynthesis protein LarC [Ilumatobacter coccineus]BAN03989.1 hypothetical protein YM304_36750 [Ilumatobacter coccineus YM16-304]
MIVWIDATAGVSGDMFLGALADIGVPIEVLQAPLDRLDLGITLRTEPVTRASLGAVKMHVDVPETRTLRHLPDIVELLQVIDEPVRGSAIGVFERLAAAEAAAHRSEIDDVHFHEVGALDSIADIVGVCAGLHHLADELGMTALHCSTVSLGSGQTRGAHGPIPVPVPAVVALLSGRCPVQAGPAPFESTTPTGAALLDQFVVEWGPMPAMTIEQVGIGAGSKDPDEVVNAMRLVSGTLAAPTSSSSRPASAEQASSDDGPDTGDLIQIDANIDDMDTRLFPAAIDAVLAVGAVDAWVTPIVMKKGRPAHTFSALTDEQHAAAVRDTIFRSTTTIGLREHVVHRHTLPRTFSTVDVDGHQIRVKSATLHGEVVNTSVEWDDVVAAAEALDRPAADILTQATRRT